jgi:hypothetical protein
MTCSIEHYLKRRRVFAPEIRRGRLVGPRSALEVRVADAVRPAPVWPPPDSPADGLAAGDDADRPAWLAAGHCRCEPADC